MTRFAADRLWPVLLVLLALLAGALVLQAVARRHATRAIVIAIHQDARLGDEDEGGEPEESEAPDEAAALSDDHARARLTARRGEVEQALALFDRAVRAHPDAGGVRAEYGFWLLAAREPAHALVELERAQALRPADARIALNLGSAKSRLGDLPGAERELRRALQIRPSYGSARIALGSVLRRRGAQAEAIQVLTEAAASGGNEERARALVALGRAAMSAGKRPEAERAFDQAISWAPAQAEIRVAIARAWLSAGGPGDAHRALEILGRAAELAPDLPQVHAVLGRARDRLGDSTGAEQAYENALRLDPGYRYARRRILRLALERRDFTRARIQAERLLQDAPEIAEHHFLAGLVAAREGRLSEGRAQYAKAIELAKGDYPEAYFNLGLLEKGAGNLAPAIAAYQRALALRPDYLAALNNLGLAQAAAGRAAEAEASYRRAIAQDPKYAAAWLNLGKLDSDRERYPEAIASFQSALAVRPGYPEAQLNLGVAYARSKKREEAITTYRALIEAQPRYVSAWYNLGVALDDAARPSEAREAWRQALALDPEHLPSLRKAAELEARAGALADAQRAYQELLDHVPGDRAARLALADLRRRDGDLAGCSQAVRAVLAEAPGNEEARKLLQQCQR